MKKTFFIIGQIFFVALFLTSCNKDNQAEKFSKLSVEENKATVEDAGIEMVNVMTRMEGIETVGVIVNLGDIISSSANKGILFSKDSKLFSTLEIFAAAAKGEKKLNDVFKAMVYAKDLNTGDPESIQDFWNENVGTYTWNKLISDWDIVSGGNKIIFLFPSSDVSLSNDASLTISNYTGVNISNPLDEDYTGDLPVSLNADLKVGSKTLVTYVFGASYNTDGTPNAIASDLTIETFKFEIDITNDTKTVSVNYKFLENGNVVMDLGASGLGLFTEDNIDANTTSEFDYVNWVYNPITQQYEPVDVYRDVIEFEEVLNSASAHFQLFNIAVRGDINVKGLVDQIKIIDEAYQNEDIDEETSNNRYVSKINEFLNLRLVNVTTNEIMAKVEAYVKHESGTYDEWTYVDFRLTFNDGSPIAMETYFDNGFDNFITELNNFIDDINTDYDLGLEPVVY